MWFVKVRLSPACGVSSGGGKSRTERVACSHAILYSKTWLGAVIPKADPGFWKGDGSTLEDSEMSRHSRRGDVEGIAVIAGGRVYVWEGVKPPITGGEAGDLPQNFSKFGCFLLQSRLSSALFSGLLSQDFSDWHRLTDYSDKKAAFLQLGQCWRPPWEPSAPLSSRTGASYVIRSGGRLCFIFDIVIVRAMMGSHSWLTSSAFHSSLWSRPTDLPSLGQIRGLQGGCGFVSCH